MVCTVTLSLVDTYCRLDHFQSELGTMAGQQHLVGELGEDSWHVFLMQAAFGVAQPGESHVDEGLTLNFGWHCTVFPH